MHRSDVLLHCLLTFAHVFTKSTSMPSRILPLNSQCDYLNLFILGLVVYIDHILSEFLETGSMICWNMICKVLRSSIIIHVLGMKLDLQTELTTWMFSICPIRALFRFKSFKPSSQWIFRLLPLPMHSETLMLLYSTARFSQMEARSQMFLS